MDDAKFDYTKDNGLIPEWEEILNKYPPVSTELP
jgi:hypothetical protein